jgi:N-acetylneuraminic acid mutarotase/subtilisin family serine protease
MPSSVPSLRTCALVTVTALVGSLAAATGAHVSPPPVQAATPEERAWEEEVAPEVLQELAAEGEADFFVDVGARADLSGAARIADWTERGAYVVERLQATATASQRPVTELLDRAGVEYRSFWIANTILVQGGTPQLAQRLAAEPAVAELQEVIEYEVPELLPSEQAAAAEAVEWGIAAVGADRVWSDVDVRGEEIVVANIDTGVQFDHPDLVDRYRGNTGDGTFDHDYNWYDPSSVCPSAEPCDNHGHGSHTMGTMVGGSAGGTGIGVAPGARWIAAKGCEAIGQTGCTVDALLAAGEWTLAPTDLSGRNPRTDLRPHIVNNSWGAHNGAFVDPYYDHIIAAWRAAGMFSLFSNGNDGARGCFTSASPADSLDTYAVGAHDIENQVAPFSSRGPGDSTTIRPSIAAPGVAVRSSIPGGYGLANGTSMAAPHVAGTVALMWSAAPALIGDLDGTRELLDQTAVDTEDLSCGGTPEKNNVWGEGRLDAHAAVLAAPIGATGLLTGTVTDVDTGEPLANATVAATSADYRRTTTTDAQGRYEISVVTGEYEVAASAYGYEPGTVAGATVPEGGTTTQDIGLTARPTVTLRGTVTDGSGHGWPLYAGLTIRDYPHGTIYTDPATGAYEVTLPADATYTVAIDAEYEGYDRLTRQIVVGTEDTAVDVTLVASIDECAAAGYRSAHLGLYEPFDTGVLPDGWTLASTIGDGWEFDDPADRTNLTGGEGGFAVIDSADGAVREDGWLTSPPVDLTAATDPILSFRTDVILTRGIVEIERSFDAGATWEQVWQRATSLRGPRLEQLPLTGAAGRAGVQVRFHYRNDTPFNGFWQVDEVLVGQRACEPVPGGLVVGQVRDDRTGEPVNGATVFHPERPELRATTVDTAGDPALGGGFYWLFSGHTGPQTLTAEHEVGQYAPASTGVDVVGSGVARADIALSSGELVVSTRAVTASAELGDQRVVTMTLTNVGTAPASYQLTERSDEFKLRTDQQELLASPGAPLQQLPVLPDGVVPPGPAPATPDPAGDDGGASRHERGAPGTDVTATGTLAEWRQLHDAPVPWRDTLAAVHNGKIYVVGGSGGVSQRNLIYDIAEDRWDFTGSFMPVRLNPAGGFIGDLLYVVGGFGPPWSDTLDTTLIYDPATDTWSEGAPSPLAVTAAGHAVLDGKLYVIGGSTLHDGDQGTSAAVMVYDPATNSWSRVADYPEPAFFQACGTIDGLLYCAGGQGADTRHLNRAYVYNPQTNTWHRIADLPLTYTRGGYTAANGLLMISGGVIGGYRTNMGFYYDPAVGQWAELPNSLFPLERMGSACGFYKVNGFFNPAVGDVPWVEQLPGFDRCDTSVGDRIPWLTTTSTTGTIAPGESVDVTVTLDAGAAAVSQPGDYTGWLVVLEDTPARNDPVRVALTATPPPTWASISGTVTGLDRCDGPGSPLAGALVRIEDTRFHAEVRTDEAGRYTYWLDSRRGHRPLPPLAVTAEQDGWIAETRRVLVRPGWTVTRDFRLRRDEPCAVVEPAEIALTVPEGRRRTATLALDNQDGAAAYDYRLVTTTHPLDPVPATLAGTGWTDAAPVPDELRGYAHAQCPEDPDHGYLFGGRDPHFEASPKAWRYDAVADRWQELAPIPAPVIEAVAVCEAGQIHLLGGEGSDRHQVYDIARDTWRAAAPLPGPRSQAAAGVWNGTIYLAGGTATGEFDDTLDRVDSYHIATGTWREAGTMPVATRSAGYVQVGPELYLAGGLDPALAEPALSAVQVLDLTTGGWSAGPDLAQPRAGVALAATDTALYAVGGSGPTEFGLLPTTTVQRWRTGDTAGWVVDPAAELPISREGGDAGFCTQGRAGGEIWSVGGASGLERALFHPLPGERCPTIAADLPWLDLSADAGRVRPGRSGRLTVTVDASGLSAGERLRATLLVTTTDPGVPELRIPVRVTVR